jgi:hypothetical protein
MDLWRILLRVIHVGSAMAWFGGAIIGSCFLFLAQCPDWISGRYR